VAGCKFEVKYRSLAVAVQQDAAALGVCHDGSTGEGVGMPEDRSLGRKPFHRLVQFVKRNIVSDVPDDIAVCEFDCRQGECQQGEWAACGRRIRKASGELFPDGHGTEGPDEPQNS